jgi:hypothetical protein
MTTHAVIGMKVGKEILTLRLSHDGYESNVAPILSNYYTKTPKIKELLKLGYIQVLGLNPVVKTMNIKVGGYSYYCQTADHYDANWGDDKIIDKNDMYTAYPYCTHQYFYENKTWYIRRIKGEWESLKHYNLNVSTDNFIYEEYIKELDALAQKYNKIIPDRLARIQLSTPRKKN